jgi:hypothetical protein
MLEWLRTALKGRRLVDSVFGEIRFQKVGFWEGWVDFQPTGEKVEVLIDASSDGPREEQQEFIVRLALRYADLLPSINLVLQDGFTRSRPSSAAGPTDSFRLVCIDVPDNPGEAADWSLSYEGRPSGYHYDVQMTGWMPSGVEVKVC